jgi:phosphoribosylanthranilate isomerase
LSQLATLLEPLPDTVERVLLFVDPQREQVEQALHRCRASLLQFHGNESAAFCASFGVPFMKVFRVPAVGLSEKDSESQAAARVESLAAEMSEYDKASYMLLDTYDQNAPGGTGKSFDWRLAGALSQRFDRLVLAGGLKAENVSSALDQASPFGLDVSSGVETAPGVKDRHKLIEFVSVARGTRSVAV